MFFKVLDTKQCRIILKLPQKVSFGTEACEIGSNSEHGHVQHVPKAPSEGEIIQKTKDLSSCWLNKLRNTQGNIYGKYSGNMYGIYEKYRGAGGGVGRALGARCGWGHPCSPALLFFFFWRISPSLGAFGTWWTCPCSDFWFNFARFGSKAVFLRYLRNGAAWFCFEESKKHCFSTPKLKNEIKKHKII